MFKLLRKYYSIEKTERKILNRTFIWLIYAFILVRIVPLRWFSHLLGDFNNEIHCDLSVNEINLISFTKKNIRRLKKRIPWKVKCFEEAIAAKKVLEKYKINSTLYLGVNKSVKNSLIAHAWLKSGDVFITGEKGHKQYAITGFYS
ncbi:MAG TPA: lasso peptide biosynthesis B2 protein [Bacteroidales bacterium]|nr:lasso peptide biosynthesis B2 protein [Bacteroidales bacterium]